MNKYLNNYYEWLFWYNLWLSAPNIQFKYLYQEKMIDASFRSVNWNSISKYKI